MSRSASAHRYTWQRSDGSVGKAWRCKWTGPDGTPHSKRGFTRKGDAEAYARDREAEARHGIALGDAGPATSRLTFEQWSQTWLERQHVRPNTITHYKACLARVLPTLGRRPVTALRANEFAAWRTTMLDTYATSTVQATWQVISMILRAAVEDEIIHKNPMPVGHGGKSRNDRFDVFELLTMEQIHAWGQAMPLVAREMPFVAATTGLRQGELLGLRLPNVDFLRRELRVVEQVQTFGAGVPQFAPLKTRSSRRTVPLSQDTALALARHLERFPAVDGEPIFRGPQGQRWRRQTFGDTYRAAARKADLPSWAHWHALRDSYATGLLRGGLDPQALVGMMGHASLDQATPYLRMWEDSLDRARDAIDAAWRRGPAQGHHG